MNNFKKPMYFEAERKPRYRFSQDDYGNQTIGLVLLGAGTVLFLVPTIRHEILMYKKRRNVRKKKREARKKVIMARGEVEAGNYKGAIKLYDEATELYEKNPYPADYAKI